MSIIPPKGSPGGASGKETTCQCRGYKRCRFEPWVSKVPWRRKWQPTPVFLPGESHGQRSLAGYSPRGHKESDMTERLSTHARVSPQNILPASLAYHTPKTRARPRTGGAQNLSHDREKEVEKEEEGWEREE